MQIDVVSLFKNINWSTFWTAIGSVATSGACIIALWQTKQSNLKKIKFEIKTAITMAINYGEPITYVCATITNLGNRDVIIKSWDLCLKKNRKLTILTNQTPIMAVNLPQRICPEETLDLYCHLDDFKKNIVNLVGENELSKNQKLVFQITDSTGKSYYAKMGLKAKSFLNSQEESNEN